MWTQIGWATSNSCAMYVWFIQLFYILYIVHSIVVLLCFFMPVLACCNITDIIWLFSLQQFPLDFFITFLLRQWNWFLTPFRAVQQLDYYQSMMIATRFADFSHYYEQIGNRVLPPSMSIKLCKMVIVHSYSISVIDGNVFLLLQTI